MMLAGCAIVRSICKSILQQASDDVGQVLISADKVAKRSARIEALELDEADTASDDRIPVQAPLNLKLGAAE